MRRQWGSVANRMSGGNRVGVIMSLTLLVCLIILGCQTKGKSTAPGPKVASQTQKAAPPTVPVAAPVQKQEGPATQVQQPSQTQAVKADVQQEPAVRTPERPADRPQQPAQQQPVATQQKAEPTAAATTPVGPNDVTPSSKTQTVATKGPKIVFEQTEFDMGEISTNSKSGSVQMDQCRR